MKFLVIIGFVFVTSASSCFSQSQNKHQYSNTEILEILAQDSTHLHAPGHIIKYCDLFLETDTTNSIIYLYRGNAYFNYRLTKKALTDAQRSIRLDSLNKKAQELLEKAIHYDIFWTPAEDGVLIKADSIINSFDISNTYYPIRLAALTKRYIYQKDTIKVLELLKEYKNTYTLFKHRKYETRPITQFIQCLIIQQGKEKEIKELLKLAEDSPYKENDFHQLEKWFKENDKTESE